MMRIKLTAILSLYFACMIMLAFAVFPHHHHSDYICFAATHCPETAGTDHHSHEHDPFAGEEGCVQHLFQTEITKSLSLDHSKICPDGHCHHFSIALFKWAGLMNLHALEADNDVSLPDIIYYEKLHGVLYTTDLSGRAPPAL